MPITQRYKYILFSINKQDKHAQDKHQQQKSLTIKKLSDFYLVGMTGFEPATTRPPDVYSNRAELHPELFGCANIVKTLCMIKQTYSFCLFLIACNISIQKTIMASTQRGCHDRLLKVSVFRTTLSMRNFGDAQVLDFSGKCGSHSGTFRTRRFCASVRKKRRRHLCSFL